MFRGPTPANRKEAELQKAEHNAVRSGPQGNYYSLNPATSPSKLGIGPLGDNRAAGTVELKLQGIYRTTEKTPVLKSTAKPIDDTWSVKGMTQPSSGGGTQVFSSAKGNFEKTQ
ncbi:MULTISPECIES: polymorphic toxin type 46 domain-containing protein [unclassified Pseudomonas]|uniref:polymorphic toxin type 46 domain-containing protein n=1 Tax=unclassified Pseudomonas TaxID=196821 RepID=UPI0034DDBA3F